MVAYDSRRTPDPSQLLRAETIEALRVALIAQRDAGREPVAPLTTAIRAAAREARERSLPPEAVLIQLKALADVVGLPPVGVERTAQRPVRDWMITACLRAYWDLDPNA